MKDIMRSAIALCAVCAITAASCRKDDDPTCRAGEGGNVEIVVFAKHKDSIITNSARHPDTAFIKYGTTAGPGVPPAYDRYFVGEAGEDHIHLPGLKCGSYFIYQTAYDTVSGKRYTGALGLNFQQTAGEVDTAISVN